MNHEILTLDPPNPPCRKGALELQSPPSVRGI